MAQDDQEKPAKGEVIIGRELELLDEIKTQLTEMRKENASSGQSRRIIRNGVVTGLIIWLLIQLSPVAYDKMTLFLGWFA